MAGLLEALRSSFWMARHAVPDRIGFEDLVVQLPRTIIKVTPVRLRHNALLNHLSIGYSRVEIEKDGIVHTALHDLIPSVQGEMRLPEDYAGWP